MRSIDKIVTCTTAVLATSYGLSGCRAEAKPDKDAIQPASSCEITVEGRSLVASVKLGELSIKQISPDALAVMDFESDAPQTEPLENLRATFDAIPSGEIPVRIGIRNLGVDDPAYIECYSESVIPGNYFNYLPETGA